MRLTKSLIYLITVVSVFTPIFLSAQDAAHDKIEDLSNSAWPMFRQGALHRGQSNAIGPVQPAIQWQKAFPGLTYSSPSIGSDGNVYIGSSDGIYSFNTTTGVATSLLSVSDYALSSPAIGNGGNVYIGSLDSNFYAIDPVTKTTLWTFSTSGEIWSSPVIGDDGTIYFGSGGGFLYALNSNGSLKWQRSHGDDGIFSSPALLFGTLFYGASDGYVYARNANTGALLWKSQERVGREVISSPAFSVTGDTLYIGSNEEEETLGHVVALARTDGSLLWKHDTGDFVISSPAVGPSGNVYVGSMDGNLHGLSSAGNVLWIKDLGGRIYGSPAIDSEENIYIGTENSEFVSVSGASGNIRWRFPTNSSVWSSPAIDSDGTLFFASSGSLTETGQFYALQATTFPVSISAGTIGEDITIAADSPAGFTPTSATLFYRQAGQSTYTATPMTTISAGKAAASDWSGVVPAATASIRGIQYYVTLSNAGGTTRSYPAVSPVDKPASIALNVASIRYPTDLPESELRIISVPFYLRNDTLKDVFEDDLGEYDEKEWRLFSWKTSTGRFQEYPDVTETLRPGKAYFLVTRTGGSFDMENATTVSSAFPLSFPVKSGWNLVGNPFAFSIAASGLSVNNGASISDIRYFDGVELIRASSDFALKPWEGYFIRVGSAGAGSTLLTMPPIEAAVVANKFTNITTSYLETSIQLKAFAVGKKWRDTQNWLGFHANALNELDDFDFSSVPSVGENLSLSFIQNDEKFDGLFMSESTSDEGQSWDIEIAANYQDAKTVDQLIRLELSNLDHLPAGATLRLLDVDRNKVLTVINGLASIEIKPTDSVRHLKLLIGTPAYAEDQTMPAEFDLDQNYPNPFNPETVIRYQIGKPEQVTIEIYNILGRRVATLINQQQDAGRYEVVWDGLNAVGNPAASGLYIYRMSAGGNTFTRKMTLLR